MNNLITLEFNIILEKLAENALSETAKARCQALKPSLCEAEVRRWMDETTQARWLIEQIGTPQELYNEPANKFVAGFIGSPAMNFFNVKVAAGKLTNNEGLNMDLPEGKAKLLKEQGYEGKEVILGIRPEDIQASNLAQQAYPNQTIEAEVVVSELLGAETMLYLRAGSTEFVSRVEARDFRNPGEKITVALNLNKSHFFDAQTEHRIID